MKEKSHPPQLCKKLALNSYKMKEKTLPQLKEHK